MLKQFSIQLETEALDAIHELLDRPENRRGLRARQIADATGISIGYVQQILGRSELVLKRRCHNRQLWWADWSDIPERYRPARRTRGRPRSRNAGQVKTRVS